MAHDGDARVAAILRRLDAEQRTAATLDAALAELDAIADPGPATALVRGQLLLELGRPAAAVTALDQAIALAPTLAAAHHALGSAYAELGREADALRAWQAAIAVDPNHKDALYNAGQAHYNRNELDEALAMWRRAADLDPEDFFVLRKVIQAECALGLDFTATQARLVDVWRRSQRPDVRGQTTFVFDQLVAGGRHVMAQQPLEADPTGEGDVMRFSVEGRRGRTGAVIRVETSAYARARGTPYVISVTEGEAYRVVDTLAALPPYAELRARIKDLVTSL
jgi:tetratricopeptide (TPR) repeat protein